MTVCLLTFEVSNNESNESCVLELVEGLGDAHLLCVKREWEPQLQISRQRAKLAFAALPEDERTETAWQAKQTLYGAPDSHWDWEEKKRSMLGSVHRLFALRNGDTLEAIMRVDLARRSRLGTVAPQKSYAPMVYVEYLATAPWNRKAIRTPPRFNGLGTVLLGAAVSLSIEEGMDGRCGLHSLLQSEGFYLRAGMTDLGIDEEAEGLRYFEFSADAAREFLKG